jgi:hypothetical protein
MIYSSENYLDIHKLEEARCILVDWKGFATSEKFRKGLNKGLDALNEFRYKNWLADTRKMKVISASDQDWANTDWFPRAIKAGMQNMAIIVSEDAFNKMAVANIMSKVPSSALTIQYFDKKEDAIAWLKQSTLVANR